jgi:preprotein translocase subunit SecG
MYILINVLFVLVAFLLIGIILIQQPKTAGGLFSGTGQSLLGTSGKTFWTKFTTVLAGIFMALCLLMALFPGNRPSGSSVADDLERQQQAAQQQAAQPSQQQVEKAPAVPAPAQQPVPAQPAKP